MIRGAPSSTRSVSSSAPRPCRRCRFASSTTRTGRRLRESYFDVFPGIWRHGDWISITRRGGAIIYGRSDATINRGGVRMGSSEIYSIVEGVPEVLDSLVVDLEFLGEQPHMALFIVLGPGAELDDRLRLEIEARLRRELTPRHVPNAILAIPEVPRTLSGKKMEVPIKKPCSATRSTRSPTRSMANPASLDWSPPSRRASSRSAGRIRGEVLRPAGPCRRTCHHAAVRPSSSRIALPGVTHLARSSSVALLALMGRPKWEPCA